MHDGKDSDGQTAPAPQRARVETVRPGTNGARLTSKRCRAWPTRKEAPSCKIAKVNAPHVPFPFWKGAAVSVEQAKPRRCRTATACDRAGETMPKHTRKTLRRAPDEPSHALDVPDLIVVRIRDAQAINSAPIAGSERNALPQDRHHHVVAPSVTTPSASAPSAVGSCRSFDP